MDLTWKVGFEIIEMHEKHVGKAPNSPPPLRVLPKRRKVPYGGAPRLQEVMIEMTLIAARSLYRRAQIGWCVEPVECLLGVVRCVIVKTPDDIADVASEIDVLGIGSEDQRAYWQVSLYEPSMCLCLQLRDNIRQGPGVRVEPRRELRGRRLGRALEDQLCNDLLHPSGAGFVPAVDDNVTVSEREPVPARGITQAVPNFVRLLRPLSSFPYHGAPRFACGSAAP